MNRIAVLSNVTIELVLSELKKEFSLYIPAGFDTWQQEVYNHDSGLYQFAPDMICVILYIDAYDEDWMYWEKGKERMGEWLNALKTLCGQTEGTPVFISSLDIRENSWNTVSLGMSGICLEEYWIREVKKLDHTFVMPLKEIVAEWGRKDFYSSKLWYLGNAPYSMKGSRAVAELIRRSYFYVAGDRKNVSRLIWIIPFGVEL